MPPEDEDNLTEGAKQLYRKKRVPHKFCPYCGHRNEPEAQVCAECGKDISWIKVPEPIPHEDKPFQRPRALPEQKKIFTWRAVLVFALIIVALAALVLVLILTTSKESKSFSVRAVRVEETCATACPPELVSGPAHCRGACHRGCPLPRDASGACERPHDMKPTMSCPPVQTPL